MKKRYIVLAISLIIILCGLYIFIRYKKNENKETELEQNVKYIETKEEEKVDSESEQKIEKIQEDLGYNIDSQIYEIKQEYDGREVIAIKPTIQYKVAMAGAIKGAKPDFSGIEDLMKLAPNHSGIWITEKSREKFLEILKQITEGQYNIDKEGYLVQESQGNFNDIDEKIKEVINGKRLNAIDINSITYIVDEVTGNIEEYPFEEIDPFSPYELFETENASLYVLTPNTYKKMEYKYVVEEMLNNIKNI